MQEISLRLWTQVGISEQFFKKELATEKKLLCNADFGRVGVGICHDIRFPELAMLYGAKGCSFFVEIILYTILELYLAMIKVIIASARCSYNMLSWGLQH